jgi:hypothetical protein
MRFTPMLLALACSAVFAGQAAAAPRYVVAGGAQPVTAGLAATDAELTGPIDLSASSDGSFLIVEAERVLRVDAAGRIATVVAGHDVADAAALPDGSVLVAEATEVVRVAQDGTTEVVAGSANGGFSGDGGPATAAQLQYASGVAPLPGGGFLIADLGNERIRLVAADGTISTVAGSGSPDSPTFGGDGRPAVKARLGYPADVAATPDGGFVIADMYNYRVRRVGPDGKITTIAGGGRRKAGSGDRATSDSIGLVSDVAVAANGDILFSSQAYRPYNSAFRVTGGVLSLVASHADSVAIEADGGVLLGHRSPSRVDLIPPAVPDRLAVAVERTTLALTPKVTAHFRTTLAASAHIEVMRGADVVAQIDAPAQAGENAVELPDALPGGVLYRLKVTLTTPAGKVATSSIRLLARGPLPVSVARDVAEALRSSSSDLTWGPRTCRRITAHRVDCKIEAVGHSGNACTWIDAFFLRADGSIVYRIYECPYYRRHPHFHGRPLSTPLVP